MRYAILLFDNPDNWRDVDEATMAELYAEYAAVDSVGGAELQPADAAKTLRMRNGELLVTDGPFAETKEVISGFYLVEAESESAAIEVARRIPTLSRMGGVIEVRPIVER